MENRSPREELIYWINERESIRILKEGGAPKPWTQDPVMQSVYFCNIHREDDRVTRWIREQWRRHANPQFHNDEIVAKIEANMCMARLVNRIDSLKNLLWPWNKWSTNAFSAVATGMSRDRKPFWGNAYVVTTHGQAMSKVDYACGVLDRAFATPFVWPTGVTLEAAHKYLMHLEGFGSFMAAQVVADLKNTPGHPLEHASDFSTWSSHGPGSLRGLSWYWECKITPSAYRSAIDDTWEEVEEHAPKMCMQDFQNCLCEYDKYMRVKGSTGRSKRRYDGHA